MLVLAVALLYPLSLTADVAEKPRYAIGDCAAFSEFGSNDRIWQITKVGKKHYGYELYGIKSRTYSEEFDYFEKFIAPFKRECGKK